jgi:N2-citryl-N6-acetyl-N6-hydroxylysine synthase
VFIICGDVFEYLKDARMMNQQLAQAHSATSFLNALFLEWKGVERNPEQFIIPLRTNERIIIPLKKYSLLGRHHYQGQYFLEEYSGAQTELTFENLIQKICQQLAPGFGTTDAQMDDFLARVNNSVRNIELSLSQRSDDIQALYECPADFKAAEQGLFIGHTFHPTPKSRSEFSDADYNRYSPEMGGHFALEWWLVKPEIFFQKHSLGFQDLNWLNDLFIQEMGSDKLKIGFVPFPIHPWQKNFILKHPDVAQYLSDGSILELGFATDEWFPTSSLRTIYSAKANYQLKFSMNVRLTNSIRHLLVKELDRGLQVHDVFSHKLGQEFSDHNPQFEVIHEPVYAALKDKQGTPIQISLMMGRFNPFKESSQAIVLATLTQDHPQFEQNLIQNYIEKYAAAESTDLNTASKLWFIEFLIIALRPLIKAQSDYGILLGSHQQNMILEIRDDRPFKSYFRDCNGTGYSGMGFKLFHSEVASLIKENGNILEGEEANYLFGYYIIINTTFNVISSIAHSGWISEEELIICLRNFLQDLKKENPKDSSFLDYLLNREALMHKGNFFCSFKDINENTESNPLSIYTEIPNPIYTRTR